MTVFRGDRGWKSPHGWREDEEQHRAYARCHREAGIVAAAIISAVLLIAWLITQ